MDLYIYIGFAGLIIALGVSIGAVAVTCVRRDRPPMA